MTIKYFKSEKLATKFSKRQEKGGFKTTIYAVDTIILGIDGYPLPKNNKQKIKDVPGFAVEYHKEESK